MGVKAKGMLRVCQGESSNFRIPYAGRRTNFCDQKSSDIFWRAFSGEEFLEQHYCPRNLFPSMSVEWIHFPRIRTFVQKRFHGLFSKKKRSKSGVFIRFQKENTFGQ